MKTNELTLAGQRIRKMRLARGWSQVVLARNADVDQKTISNIERGGNMDGSVTVRNVSKVADALNVPLWVILLPENDNLMDDAILPTVVHNYAKARHDGRTAIARVSEMAAQYAP